MTCRSSTRWPTIAIVLALLHGCNSQSLTVDQRPHPVDASMTVMPAGGGANDIAEAGTRVVVSGTYRLDDRNPALLRPNVFIEIVRGAGKDAVTMASHSAEQDAKAEAMTFTCTLKVPDVPGKYTVAAKHARREGITILAARELTVLPRPN